MKKKVEILILVLITLIVFNIKADANVAPYTIRAGNAFKINKEYVAGYPAWYKTTAARDRELYCEVADLPFPEGLTLTRGSLANDGFVYIMKNKPITRDIDEDYYVTQMAVWWYKDYLTGGRNLDTQFKNYCTSYRNSHKVCGKIYNLVEGAKKHREEKGTLTLSASNLNFTTVGNYYISSIIRVTSQNLNKIDNIKLVGAPSGSAIINDSFYNNNGTFQIRVPISSVSAGRTVNFKVEAIGSYQLSSVYDYSYTSAYQKVIDEKIYSTSYTVSSYVNASVTRASAPVTTKAPVTTTQAFVSRNNNSLTIKKVDENNRYLSNADISLYYGNCVNLTCYSRNLFTSWRSTNRAKVIENLPTGYYTIVETKAPNGYKLANKALVNVQRTNGHYTYTLVNEKYQVIVPPAPVPPAPVIPITKSVRISKTDITGLKEIAGATLILKNSSGQVIDSWVSTNSPRYVKLNEGSYTLHETKAPTGYKLNPEVVEFKLDRSGNLSVRDANGKYVSAQYVRMLNTLNDTISINKLDKNTNNFLIGAVLELRSESGEVLRTWTTGNSSYNIALSPGNYSIKEVTTPNGYLKNNEIVYFKLLDDGTLMVRDSSGNYTKSAGIIIYNVPEEEYEIIVDVPKTGLSSTLTYLFGTLTLVGGSWILIKNGKFN